MSRIETIGSMELLEMVPEISYRQLNYWRMNGIIEPMIGGAEPGSGHPVQWSPRDVQRLRAIAGLMRAMGVGADRRQTLTNAVQAIWEGLDEADTVEFREGPVSVTVSINGAP